ncbi:MAG: GNAT family acetyltransferase [Lachnospiraceae bacterium]|nr:GNAT family acetyltransferase [Lachnospiraceae bacterium]
MIEGNKISVAYIKKVEYTGGYKGMRYMMRKSGDGEMEVSVWPEPLCYSKADKETMIKKNFPLTEEGKEEAVRWLNELHAEKFASVT